MIRKMGLSRERKAVFIRLKPQNGFIICIPRPILSKAISIVSTKMVGATGIEPVTSPV